MVRRDKILLQLLQLEYVNVEGANRGLRGGDLNLLLLRGGSHCIICLE